jgi:Tfp pilus assembly protein PilF
MLPQSLYYRPDNPPIDVMRAEIYRQLGRPQRALGILDHLEDNVPAENIPARAWLLMGLTYADLGAQEQAKGYLQLAAQRAGDSSDLLLELAEAQYVAGDLAEARLYLGRVLAKDSQNSAALQLQTQLDQSFAKLAAESASLPLHQVGLQRSRE